MKQLTMFSLGIAMLITFVSFGQHSSVSEQAKQKTITGIVSDTAGPLPGANIVVRGTARSTQTDFDGKYSIKAKVGEVKVGKFATINVVLDGSVSLDEVVVTGHGVKKAKTVMAQSTRSVSEQPLYFKTQKAQVAGLQISHATPGSTKVIIRGVGTINDSQTGGKDSTIQQAVVATNDEDYNILIENAFESPKTAPLSTFSIDVDNASYTNVRRFINGGQAVPKDAVRVEEMVNFFKYQYPQPTGSHPFSINTEYSECPWNKQNKLVRIGLQGKNIPTDDLPVSNLVFLIDVSGSMSGYNRLPLVIESLKVLVGQLRKEDKISIVVYAGAAGLVLAPTSGSEKQTIIDALDQLQSGGSTAGGAGIQLAYKTAQENFIKGGNNRVILATDGDFNVGASSDSDMQTLIEEKRKSGVFLTCLGYGMGNYKDSKLETLADKGNGNYAYIDNIQEANRFLGKEFKGSMFAIAKDVKIQIEFNPAEVKAYRLIGYENRKLRPEDFKNDAIDAGELGSGHTVTALYEIIPADANSELFTETDALKYTKVEPTATKFSNELATIKFRYKKPDGDKSIEMVQVIDNKAKGLEYASSGFKFSTAVAWFGLKLRDSKLVANKSTKDIRKLAREGLAYDEDGYKAEFIRLVEAVN